MKRRGLIVGMIVFSAFCVSSVATPQNSASTHKTNAAARSSAQEQSSGIHFASRSKSCFAAHARPGNVERRGRATDFEVSCALIEKLYQ
jgi:hypothetical protein